MDTPYRILCDLRRYMITKKPWSQGISITYSRRSETGWVTNPQAGEARRNMLLRAALEAAIARLDDAGPDAIAAFAAIGEVTFWVVAADEAVRSGTSADRRWREAPSRLPLFQGMRYPRNGTAHESTAWEHAFRDPYTDRYWSYYGAWVWSPLPAP